MCIIIKTASLSVRLVEPVEAADGIAWDELESIVAMSPKPSPVNWDDIGRPLIPMEDNDDCQTTKTH